MVAALFVTEWWWGGKCPDSSPLSWAHSEACSALPSRVPQQTRLNCFMFLYFEGLVLLCCSGWLRAWNSLASDLKVLHVSPRFPSLPSCLRSLLLCFNIMTSLGKRGFIHFMACGSSSREVRAGTEVEAAKDCSSLSRLLSQPSYLPRSSPAHTGGSLATGRVSPRTVLRQALGVWH